MRKVWAKFSQTIRSIIAQNLRKEICAITFAQSLRKIAANIIAGKKILLTAILVKNFCIFFDLSFFKVCAKFVQRDLRNAVKNFFNCNSLWVIFLHKICVNMIAHVPLIQVSVLVFLSIQTFSSFVQGDSHRVIPCNYTCQSFVINFDFLS